MNMQQVLLWLVMESMQIMEFVVLKCAWVEDQVIPQHYSNHVKKNLNNIEERLSLTLSSICSK